MMVRFPNLKPFLRPTKYQEWIEFEVAPNIKDGNMIAHKGNIKMKLRFIPANHCPGAAMLHFKGPMGDILHTADFRFNGPRMIQDIGDHYFDYLYLDNTFCSSELAIKFPNEELGYKKMKKRI